MMVQRYLSCFMIVALIVQPCLSSAASGDQTEAVKAQVSVGELRQRLYDKLKPSASIQGGPKAVSYTHLRPTVSGPRLTLA